MDSGASSGALALSKFLSLGVIAGTLVGKLPQVQKIWKARSADGISVASIWIEATSMGVQLAYNVVRQTPISTYGEVPILFLQLLLLAAVAAWAQGRLWDCGVWLRMVLLVSLTAAMCTEVVPVSVTAAAYAANALLAAAVVLPQVAMNFARHSTGQLSFTVVLMATSGLTTRVFTTLVEVDDPVLRMSVTFTWLLNVILLSQFWAFAPKRHKADYWADEDLSGSGSPACFAGYSPVKPTKVLIVPVARALDSLV